MTEIMPLSICINGRGPSLQSLSLAAILFLLAALFLSACEGPVGPEGPAGPQGGTGERGATGEQGPPGNANVQSFTVTLRTSDFQVSEFLEVAGWSSGLITREIHERGVVLAYTDLGSGGEEFYALPFSLGEINLSYATEVGTVFVIIQRPRGSSPRASVFDGDRIRFVAIAPAATSLLDEVDKADYKAVMNALSTAH